jgi:hypothetical protein
MLAPAGSYRLIVSILTRLMLASLRAPSVPLADVGGWTSPGPGGHAFEHPVDAAEARSSSGCRQRGLLSLLATP